MSRSIGQINHVLSDLANYINGNGGWTVIGWHKHRIVNPGEAFEQAATNTERHLVRLEPTTPPAGNDLLPHLFIYF